MTFAAAAQLADAVLCEGYVLYPYRASALKNRFRWTFGALAPQAWSERGGSDPWWLEAQCLLEDRGATLRGRLRFVQVEERVVDVLRDDGFERVSELVAGGRPFVPWDEGHLREIDFTEPLERLRRHEVRRPFALAPARAVEAIDDGKGTVVGRLVRRRAGLAGQLRLSAHAEGDDGLVRLCVRVENLTAAAWLAAPRAQAMKSACASTHLLLALEGGSFVSLTDPPARHAAAAARCRSVGTHPALVGDLVLAAPIILEDHARVAPESLGDFCDATEIDEILALRTLTLTAEEKALARATDPRAAAIVARVEAMTPAEWQRLHGAERAEPCRYRPGSRVRLCPGARRSDAQDLLFAGFTATVAEVIDDVEGHRLLAVTIDDDPARDMHEWYGRYHYYRTDEVKPL
jgi:hypothetical protein